MPVITPEAGRIAARLRVVARHLLRREGGPSLDGYELEEGLLAAADIIEGKEGPTLHDDITPVVRNAELKRLPRVSLRALMTRLEVRDEEMMRTDWAFSIDQDGTFSTPQVRRRVRAAVLRWVARARAWNKGRG